MKRDRRVQICVMVVAFVLIMNGLTVPILAQNTPTVAISPASVSLSQNATATLAVDVANVVDLFDVELVITFDAGILAVQDAYADQAGIQITHGDFISPDFIALNEVSGGTIRYRVTTLPPNPAGTGSGTLARIMFEGLSPGTSNISFEAILKDSQGTVIAHTSQPGTVSVVAEPTPVTPSTTPSASPTPVPTSVPTATPPPVTPTPMPVTPTPMPPPTLPPACHHILGYHIVRPGETLYAIGRAYAAKPTSIAACNRIVNINHLYVNTRLAIPADSWYPIPPGPVAQPQFGIPSPPTPTCRYYHTVNPGETLMLIAWRYGVSMWDIARANAIYNLNLVYVGETLCIP